MEVAFEGWRELEVGFPSVVVEGVGLCPECDGVLISPESKCEVVVVVVDVFDLQDVDGVGGEACTKASEEVVCEVVELEVGETDSSEDEVMFELGEGGVGADPLEGVLCGSGATSVD